MPICKNCKNQFKKSRPNSVEKLCEKCWFKARRGRKKRADSDNR